MWNTAFTQQYGLDLPFASAGMGFYSMPPLAAAVSNAGGLGVLGISPAPAPAMAEMVRAVKQLTSRPFGVDLVVAQTAFGPATTDEHIDICVRERIPVVVFFWTPPPARWVEALHRAGCKVWMQVGSLRAAREAAAAGMDAIVAQGSEGGGHNKSAAGLVALLPAVVDAVAPLPVLAAGGIADGRGVAAALALGAEAVWVGTRLLASAEAYAHADFKQRLLAASCDDITRTAIFGPEWPNEPMKVLRNGVVREWQGWDERTPPPPEPPQVIGQTLLGGQPYAMPKFSAVLPTPDTTGDLEEMCLPAGEGVGMCRRILPAAQIIAEMMEEAQRVIAGRLPGLVGPGTSTARASASASASSVKP
ncbi:MAG: nitronate monooxygenase [Gemmataceae bacterium]|nr:nitronate monooxygenase [Gemmataceae bacterium]